MAAGAYSRLFLARGGLFADKWEQYLAVYDREIAPLLAAGRPVRLLEIGVAGGGSLAIWEELLPPGSRIVGIDIEPGCASLPFGPAVTVHILDGTDRAALTKALGDDTFDIIIDDGSHRSADIVATFGACFPRLAPGGLYIIEDLHAAYWPAFGGRYRDPGSAIEFLKTLVDALHADHFVPWDTAIPEAERGALAAFGAEIVRIAFHDSMAVIERGAAARTAPYRRMGSGDGAEPVPVEAGLAPAAAPMGEVEPLVRALFPGRAATKAPPEAGAELPAPPAGTRMPARLRALWRRVMRGATRGP